MKDIHSHILFGVDDGSKTLEESINIINNASRNGYTDIILTPHYRKIQDFVCDNKTKREVFKKLLVEVEKRGIKINLYLGNEVTIDDELFDNIKNRNITTLNKSRYMLLELPFTAKLPYIHELIFKLRSVGIIPIIAHPERYSFYFNDYEEFEKMINEGALLQGNLASLYNKYGQGSKDMLEGLLKRHMVHFIGSDIHKETSTSYSRIHNAIDKIEMLTDSRKMAMELVDSNIDKVIKDEMVEAYPIRHKKQRNRLFGLFGR